MCDYSGFPSSDGTIRLFSQSECEKKGGIFHASGECTKTEGGSFSWDCREKNNDPVDMVMQKKYYILAALVVGGVVLWRMRK